MDEDDRGEHVQRLCAEFGLAVYLAQCLEHGIVNALLLTDLVPHQGKTVRSAEEWSSKVDAFLDQKFEHTLGRMIRELQNVTSVPAELETLLSEALRKRNWLVHHYFRERAEHFVSASGRDRMIGELEEVQQVFLDAGVAIETVVKPLREKYGYTERMLAEAFNDLLGKNRDDL